ncbi:unnamed protein product [Anisakis simplex]|uniref:BZIP domain-containing protein n=1 Tax=Anisakis simplex TaxID=6269 RepID=A0A0M3KBK3_ANISI|nr:unnamed protein product [Anisakis simplex]
MTNLHDDEIDQCTSKEPEEAVPEDKHSKALKKKGGRPRKEDLMQVRHSKLVYGEIPDDSEELSLEAKLKRDKRRRDNLLAAARYRHKKDERINELRKGNEQLTRMFVALTAAIISSKFVSVIAFHAHSFHPPTVLTYLREGT